MGSGMKVIDACRVISEARRTSAPGAVLVSTMSAMFAFDELGEERCRIDSVPLMGGAACLGLGIALARPDLAVIVVDGDASLLMELGGLVTVASAQPRRLLHFVVNNRTQFGGVFNLQRPGTGPAASDFVRVADGAGYSSTRWFDDERQLAAAMPELLALEGATLIELCVEPDPRRFGPGHPQPPLPDRQFERMRDAVPVLRAELAGASS